MAPTRLSIVCRTRNLDSSMSASAWSPGDRKRRLIVGSLGSCAGRLYPFQLSGRQAQQTGRSLAAASRYTKTITRSDNRCRGDELGCSTCITSPYTLDHSLPSMALLLVGVEGFVQHGSQTVIFLTLTSTPLLNNVASEWERVSDRNAVHSSVTQPSEALFTFLMYL